MAKEKEIPEETKNALKTVVDEFDREDTAVRERQVRQWRRYKYLWEGFTNIWYSEVAHDWRVWDESSLASSSLNQEYYDKPVNVFRAYLESIIAALSISVPPIKCFPDDADSSLDCMTAKAGDQIAQLIYRHNNVPLLWLHALYIFCTEGMTACYSYPKTDKEYGTYTADKTEDVEEESYVCQMCNASLQDDIFDTQLENQFQPDDTDVLLQDAVQNGPICPNCGSALDPNLQKSKLIVTRIVGTNEYPKSRICLEIYGGLVVKVPNYARKQCDCPYLIQSYETHYSNAIAMYPHLRNKSGSTKISPSGGVSGPDTYAQWARLNPQYHGEYPTQTVTVRNTWLRPSAYNVLADENQVKELEKRFPNGCKVVFVNDDFAEACNESLDDCWTLTYNPLSDYIHFDPAGSQLVSIQDITNDIISLVLQTIEHGIGQTFADPKVLNFKKYGQTEVAPGSVYPVNPAPGKSLQESFYELKTANLSPEVLPVLQKIQELGQLVSGALPSLFGGTPSSGSNTASEYSMSRAQAMQRQQNTYKIFTTWWKEIFSKVVPMFINEMVEDERDVQMVEGGSFMNSYIRKAETEGRIGRVELEANENIPLSWGQQKDIIMELLQNQNPEVIRTISDPNNIKNLQEAIGLTQFNVPGEDDRQKQLDELKELMIGTPMPAMDGNPEGMESSVPIEPLVDDHEVHAAVCRRFLVSEAGRQLRKDNPDGYQNILLHMQAHMMLIAPISQPLSSPNEANKAEPKGDATPLAEKDNVQTEA